MAQVVIAARGGCEAKSRCAGALAPQDRAELTAVMLDDMLSAVAGASGVSQVWVVTPTPELAELAAGHGAQVIHQSDPAGLNAAFDSALEEIAERAPYDAVALLPGDLPLLKANELEAALALAQSHAVVLAPALDGGTGAMILRAGGDPRPAFGTQSFQRHALTAEALGLSVAVVAADSLALDVDRLEDLLAVLERGVGTRTAAFLFDRLQPRIGS